MGDHVTSEKLLKDHVTNEKVYAGLPKLSDNLRSRRLGIAGHCVRHPEEAAHHTILWEPTHGTSRRGAWSTLYELRHSTQKRYWVRQHTRDRDCYVVQRDLEWSGPLLQSFNWEEVLWGGNAEFSSMIIEPLKGRFAVRSECCNSFKFLGLRLNQIGTLIYNIVMTDGSGSLYQRVGGR